MAIDVSKIPNNSKFDPVREALLDLQDEIGSGVAGVSSVNSQTGAVSIAAGSNVSITTSSGVITISSTASGGSLDGALTLAAGDGISLSSPSVFDGSTDLTVTITNSDRPNDGTLSILTGAGIEVASGTTWSAETTTWSTQNRTWSQSVGSSFSANQLGDSNITIIHGDTSDVADVTNAGGNVLQSVQFDDFGHVIDIYSTNLDTRYLAFKNVYTEDDDNTLVADAYNDTLTLSGSPSVSVTSDVSTDTVTFSLSLNDISFDEDGNRIARGLLYYQQSGTPIAADKPDGTFDFTTYTINLTGGNASDWSENPPQSGSPSVTLYVLRYESIDTGGGTTDARAVDFGDIQEATGFEAPVTFSDFTSGGRTIIDGGRIQTGSVSSNGFVAGSTATDYSTEGTKIFLEGNGQNYAGDIISEQFRIVNGSAFFKGSVTVGTVELTESNTLNSNTTAGDVSGLGDLATLDTIDSTYVTNLGLLATLNSIDSTYVTDLGALATQNTVTTGQVTGLGAIALLNQIDATNSSQISGLGSLALASVVSTSQITGLGALATQDQVDAATEVIGLGGLAFANTVDATSNVLNLGTLALLNNINLSYITNAGAFAALDQINSGNATTYIGGGAIVTNLIAAEAVVAEKIAVEDLAADTAFMNKLLATDGTFTGTLQAGQVTVTDNEITLNATTSYAAVGEVIFNNDFGNMVANMRATNYGSNEVTIAAYVSGTTKGDQLILASNRFYLGRSSGSFVEEGTGGTAGFLRLYGLNGIILVSLTTITGVSSNTYVNPTTNRIYRVTSSRRYKTNIEDYTKGIEDLQKLRPVTFVDINSAENGNDKLYSGFIAEEVHDAGLEEYVEYNENNEPESVHYQNMVALLTKAVQEQQAQIEKLTQEIEELKTKI